ncbi:hypothetical protein G6O69_11260 [Pseudenhygromyxa sp. WMMC2535]|uniref:hypothetical protein n=1 Tax=Pseudenhygromyxa sp. WMMC2535 TaxID=2712867 RepID=UPI0015961D99|nr:hypothetical protein [Pseudenhygromyxa sp. WMMC2535]NVB38410.1 hypothetical protein [Pseudenhygromyxa sp. WMMC2535]
MNTRAPTCPASGPSLTRTLEKSVSKAAPIFAASHRLQLAQPRVPGALRHPLARSRRLPARRRWR